MHQKRLKLIVVILFLFVTFSFVVSAADCWTYVDSSTCATDDNCLWYNDQWSDGGWCGEVNCWSLYSQTQCTNSTLTSTAGINCQWKTSSSNWGWCEQTSCWNYEGDQTSCESTSDDLNCMWEDKCTGWNSQIDCYSKTTASTCLNVTGCNWGECMDQGCWNYNGNSTCTAGTGRTGGSLSVESRPME